MANSLTNAVPMIFAQGLMALRENAVTPRLVLTDFSSEVAQKGDTITMTVPSAMTVSDVTPGPTPPAGQDIAPEKRQIQLNYWKSVDFSLSDKEVAEILAGTRNQQITEAIKALGNFVDTTVLGLYIDIYGFAGAIGTTPFGTDLAEAIEARKVLSKQLAPTGDRRLVIDPDAEAKALALRALQDASWRQSPQGIVEGQIGRALGFDWFMNQNVPTFTNGTLTDGSGHKALVNGATAVGDKTVNIDAVSLSGTVKKGEIFTVAGDTQTYVVTGGPTYTASGNAIAGMTFEPGCKVIWADNAQLTFKGAASAVSVENLAFHRDAFGLAVRSLAAEYEGGSTILSQTDPVTGIPLRLEISREHKRTKISFDLLFGVGTIRRELAVRMKG